MKAKNLSRTSNRTNRVNVLSVILIGLCITATVADAQQQRRPRESPNNLKKRDSRVSELQPPNMQKPGSIRMGMRTLEFPDEYRTIDGTNNNVANPEWGATDIPLLRFTTIAYEDGVNEPSGSDRPNAREISNKVSAQEESIFNRFHASDLVWQWGQFLDHDITLTPVTEPEEEFDIIVPAGDPYFDPSGTGSEVIGMDRSFGETVDGVRQQINEITAYIDASNVYGSDLERADDLRTNDGTGMLRTSDGNLLPFNVNAFPNAPTEHDSSFFIAGDFRANEQVGLTALHTLFVREHNYWAGVISRANSGLDGDQIYEAARAIVGAEMQIITYNEYLPRLLGERALPRYQGYREDVNPGIGNEFATSSYRYGHSMLSAQLLRLDRRLNEIDEGHISLRDAFFNPNAIIDQGGIDPLLRGLAHQPAQEIDTYLVDDVRNFLFGPPGSGGFDLAALNIQRGRDHGLPTYNEVREDYGLDPVDDFDEITRNPDLQEQLEDAYGDVDLIDPWVGGLAEDPVRGAMVGELVWTVLRDQFLRLRDGDRFWYQNHLSRDMQRLLEGQTLAKIIARNTEIGRELTDDPWRVDSRSPVPPGEGMRGPGHGPRGPMGPRGR